jgi:hypothetical protein
VNAQGGSTLYVGDAGNNVVEVFNAGGQFVRTVDGTSTPQGRFQCLGGVAVDQGGNLWTTDRCTNNVDEFSASGAFVRQWNDKNGSPSSIAVDSTHGTVYLIDFSGEFADRFTLTGTFKGALDAFLIKLGAGFDLCPSALALDPKTGNLYVDHNSCFGSANGDVTVYDHNGVKLDDVGLSQSNNSLGLTFSSLPGSASKPGQQRLYTSDASNNNVTIFAPQRTPGAPLVTAESVNPNGPTTAQVRAGIVPLGSDTSCKFQLVSNADFLASGFANATSVGCTPSNLGSGFAYQAATADLSGLATGSYYHFRVVATSSAGTTTGGEQEFQVGPGAWAPFNRCPVDDPAMLATDGGTTTLGFCIASNSTHGSITLGKITTATGNTNLQFGSSLNEIVGGFSVIPPAGGSLVADPVQLSTPVGPVTAVTESAGAPSNFNLFAGIQTGVPIVTIPIKIQLANNSTLGPNCFIGSNQNPILLNPENTDLSNSQSIGGFFNFDPNGAVDPSGPLTSLVLTGLVQGDDTFAVPGATGCGTNGSLDGAVDAVAGVPSPSGNNHLVLDDASSALAAGVGVTGQQLANDWHAAFG